MSGNPARKSPAEIVGGLHQMFATNLTSPPSELTTCFEAIDDILRTIDLIKTTQSLDQTLSKHQIKMQVILDEIFSDITIAMYLCCCGLFVVSRMSARRALELGVALIVMWDNPVLYLAWKADNEDLTFKSLLATAASCSYRSFISEIIQPCPSELDTAKFHQIYKRLSNTVHGKSIDLVPAGPQRYSSDPTSRQSEANLLRESAQLTLTALLYRLPKEA